MIEIGKKYKLKDLNGFKPDNNWYKVIDFYNFDFVICEDKHGERFIFMKNALIDKKSKNTSLSSFEIY